MLLTGPAFGEEISSSVGRYTTYSIKKLNTIINSHFQCHLFSLDKEKKELCENAGTDNQANFISEILNNEKLNKTRVEYEKKLDCIPKDISSVKAPYISIVKLIKSSLESCHLEQIDMEDESPESLPKKKEILQLLKNKNVKENIVFPILEDNKSVSFSYNSFKKRINEFDLQLMSDKNISSKEAFKIHQKIDGLKKIRTEIITTDPGIRDLMIRKSVQGMIQDIPPEMKDPKKAVPYISSYIKEELFDEFSNKNVDDKIKFYVEFGIKVNEIRSNILEDFHDEEDSGETEEKIERLFIKEVKLMIKNSMEGYSKEERKLIMEMALTKPKELDSVISRKLIPKIKNKKDDILSIQSDIANSIKAAGYKEKNRVLESYYDAEEETSPHCENYHPVCKEQKFREIEKFASADYTANFFGDQKRKSYIQKVFNDSKKIMSNRMKQSSYSKKTQKQFLESIKKLKVGVPEVSPSGLKSYIQTLTDRAEKIVKESGPEKMPFAEALNIAGMDLKEEPEFKDYDIDNLSSIAGGNAQYETEKHTVHLHCSFATEKVEKNHSLKMLQIMLHELGHSLDPNFNNSIKISRISKIKLESFQRCVDGKFKVLNKRGENFADLLSYEAILPFLQSNDLDPIQRNDLIYDSLSNSCEKKINSFEEHHSSYVREQQFFSHPLFKKAYPEFDANIKHGEDCGGIIWPRK